MDAPDSGSLARLSAADHDVHRYCDNCWGSDHDLSSVVRGMADLQTELARLRLGDSATALHHQPVSLQHLVRAELENKTC